MSDSLAGTVALVTGASSGIGEAAARALAGHGASARPSEPPWRNGPYGRSQRAGALPRLACRHPAAARFTDITPLQSADVADAIAYVVTRRCDVAINEVLVRPTTQPF